MQNSDSGTKFNSGDRVRVRHNPRHDSSYSAEQNQARQALAGQEGSIRERTIAGDYRVAPPGSAERGAWFFADELSPIVTDADGCEVGAPAAPFDVLDAAVQQALAAARREAQGWHSAALLARGEAEEARDALRVVQGEADALRGKLGAAEGDRDGWRSRALAAEAKLTRETEEVARLEAALRTRDVQLDESRRQRKAAEGKLAAERSIHETAALGAVKLARRLADAGAAWGKMRAFLLALPRPLGAAGIEGVDAVDKALGGVDVAEHPLAALRRASFDNVRAVLVGLGATVEADNRAGSFTATLPAPVPIEALMWLQATLAETLPGDVCLVVKGPALAEQKAGPWQDGNLGLRWRPRGDDPTRSAATVGSGGWTSFASPPAGGPEGGAEGEKAADRALLAAGWTLENPTGGIGDALPCELTVNFSEWHGTAHAVPTSPREPRRWRLTFPMASPLAAAKNRNLIAAGGPNPVRHAAQIGGWVGRVMVVQRAPVAGSAIELEVVEWIEPSEAKPERECCWEATLDQRVAEIEARLGRLESGEALAKMLEGYGDARRP